MRGLLLVVAAVGLWAVVPAPAGAQEACTNRVFEDAARLGEYRQSVDLIAQTLSTAFQADVYVRVVGRVPNGDLDAWYQSMQAQCANWQDDVGVRKPNLIVLAVAVEDRRTGLYYGVDHVPALDPAWRQIQIEQMNPHFQRGEFGLGIVNGLTGVASAVAQVRAATPSTVAPAVPQTPFQDRRPVTEEPDAYFPDYSMPDAEPEGGAPAWGLFMGAAAVIGLLGLGAKIMGAGGTGTGLGRASGPGPAPEIGRRYSNVDPLERKHASSGGDSPISGHVPRSPGGGSTSW